MKTCLNCEKSDQLVPLIEMWYQGEEVYICPQCFPVMIHKPANLADKLPGLENIRPADHEH
jgi:hypothetical protein